LVLLDRNMPGIDGYEGAERLIRSAPERPPAILILSSPGVSDTGVAKSIGIFTQLAKPLRRAALLEGIRQALAGHTPPAPRGAYHVATGFAETFDPSRRRQRRESETRCSHVGENGPHRDSRSERPGSRRTVRTQRFDLILMDIQMPVLSGVDATHAIRVWEQSRAHTPIIAMTAHAMAGDAEKFLGAGMGGYVSKPIDVAILRAEIDRLMQSKISAISRMSTIGTVIWSGTRFCAKLLAVCSFPYARTILWVVTAVRNSSSCSTIAVQIPRWPVPRRFAKAFVLVPCRPLSARLTSP